MIDKKLEENIKKAGEFIELWKKFYEIFEKAISSNPISSEIERNFHSTKRLLSIRFEDLMDSLNIRPSIRILKHAPIYNILFLKNLKEMSEDKSSEIKRNWQNSLENLEILKSRLERKKMRIQRFNRFFYILKNKIVRKKHRCNQNYVR